MIDDGNISQGKYVETVDNTHQDLKCIFKISCSDNFTRQNITTKYVLFLINQHVFLLLLKQTNLIRLKILIFKTSNLALV